MKTFCVLPWTHLNVWPDGNVYSCCMADNAKPLSSLKDGTLAEAWNSDRLKRMRLDMLAGRESPECSKCFEIERSGMPSLRTRSNSQFSHHAAGARDATGADGSVRTLKLAYFDIRFSNVCNLKCRTCCPDLSSAWHQDAAALSGGAPVPGLLHAAADPERLWNEVEPLLERAEEIYFAGGEPLVMEEHYRMLDALVERKLFHVRLCYNTNFSTLAWKGRDLAGIWSRFEVVRVGASLDGSGARGEYLRKNISWEQVEKNRRILAETCPDVEFHLAPTLSAFNAFHLSDFHREWLDRGWCTPEGFYVNLLLEPPEYRAQVLPRALRERAAAKMRAHAESLRPLWTHRDQPVGERWLAAADFMLAEDREDLLPAFKKRTAELDALRGESCAAVFPELADILRP